MPVSFRIYCSQDDLSEEKPSGEVDGVGLYFRDADEMKRFGKFVMRCADGAAKGDEWDHEHFFGDEPHPQNISIGILYPENV